MSDYVSRERELLTRLAWATIADPKSSTDDKRAARDRIEHVDGSKYDWDRLSADELGMSHDLNEKAAGHWPPRRQTVLPVTRDEQICSLHTFAEQAQIVADDARLELDAEMESKPSEFDWRAATVHRPRCATCGRYEDDTARIGSKPVDMTRRERAQRNGKSGT